MNRLVEIVAPAVLRNGGVAASLLGCSLSTALYATLTTDDAAALVLYGEALRAERAAASDVVPAERAAPAASAAKHADVAAGIILAEARLVARHAASACALGLWSAASTFWAFRDLRAYRSQTPLELERYVARTPFPMFRTSSLAAFSASSAVVFFGVGGLRFQPTTPPHLGQARALERADGASALRVLLRRHLGGGR